MISRYKTLVNATDVVVETMRDGYMSLIARHCSKCNKTYTIATIKAVHAKWDDNTDTVCPFCGATAVTVEEYIRIANSYACSELGAD